MLFRSAALVAVADGVNEGRVQFDVTGFVADRVAAANHYVSFAVNNGGYYSESTGPFGSVTTVSTYSIAGRLDADPAARPTLTLTVVPEASARSLAGVALAIGIACGAARASAQAPSTGRTRADRTRTQF